ncbi:hypothetical protein F383_37307 [Gossypium arboreum]|uniref:Uncharacterized protein n=1 Tax=Gossypium arboreum TaxID=29729 RepID=A0A0B0M7B7_GOSAR|nr:hypothetical protein F383_37307 [Gossypium arboreum]
MDKPWDPTCVAEMDLARTAWTGNLVVRCEVHGSVYLR